MTHDDDTYRDWDAAYVLGALSPDDRRTYEAFLAENPDRAKDVSEISGIPGLLKGLSLSAALALTTDVSLQEKRSDVPADVSSLTRSLRVRRRKARVIYTVALLSIAASTLLIGLRVGQDQGKVSGATASERTIVSSVAMASNEPNTVAANLSATRKPWGTLLDINCTYSSRWSNRAETLDLVITTTTGARVLVATWASAGHAAKGIAAATQLPVDEIRSISIQDGRTHAKLATARL